LGQGRLFRIDFTEASRKSALASRQTLASARRKSSSIEHFWLCERCAATSTVELNEANEVRVAPRASLTQESVKAPVESVKVPIPKRTFATTSA
jgi:hypothetical protein